MDHREIFVRVVEAGSFTAAAKQLGMSTSYVSRCVKQLEESLGVPLLARSTRKVQPTEVGYRYHARLAPLLLGLAEADLEVHSERMEPSGNLRIALPHALGRRWVLPVLLEYQRRWPEVRVQLHFSDRRTDPLEVDLTLRAGDLDDSSLVARRLVTFENYLVCSPECAERHGIPSHPQDLEGKPAVVYSGYYRRSPWRFERGEERVMPTVDARFECDSGEALVQAGEAGLGYVLQPNFLVGPSLASGALIRLLPEWHNRTMSFWAVTPSRLQPATVRAFVELLEQNLRSEPWLRGDHAP